MKNQFNRLFLMVALSAGISAQAIAGGGHHHHHHGAMKIDAWQQKPSITINVHRDSKSGFNLELVTQHFKFAPDNVNKIHQPNQGHAHLFINGKKITRLYGHWYYLSELPQGENLIEVRLNGNDHSDWTLNGVKVAAQATVVVN